MLFPFIRKYCDIKPHCYNCYSPMSRFTRDLCLLFLSYIDHQIDSIQTSSSSQLSTSGQISTAGTIRDESISSSTPTTSPHSDKSGYITLSTESVKHEDGSTFSNSPTAEIDVGSSKSSLISTKITTPKNKESSILDTDQSNSHMYRYYTTESAVNTYIPENAPQCHCTTPKYIIFWLQYQEHCSSVQLY